MEQQQQLPLHPQHHQTQEDPNGSSGAVVASAGSSKSSFLCRQSSTRWIPTTDQIRILKDLYYNSGVRSPSAEQIQRISARLRQYGKIEGKNVFYWFQNHKARERQKKRLTVDVPPNPPTPNTKFTTATLSPAGISPTSCALYGAAHHHVGTFRDYSLTSGVGGSNVIDGGMAWLGGMDNASSVPQHYYHQQQHRSIYYYEDSNCCYHYSHQLHHQKEDEQKEARIETLPLFPIRAQEHKEQANAGDYESHSFYRPPFLGHPQQDSQVGHHYCNGNDAFLELTLNSYHPSHP